MGEKNGNDMGSARRAVRSVRGERSKFMLGDELSITPARLSRYPEHMQAYLASSCPVAPL